MELKEIYKQLTSVDIEKQKQVWNERGKGYYGEYLLFCELHENIRGASKILMNIDVPVANSKTTEIDLILIHETGLYVFEIKHYKGTIYGKDTDKTWTQYFRTTKNSTFKNPMEQNAYHVKAIQNLFPDVPIKSIIVFTNTDCDIKVNNSNKSVEICSIYNVADVLLNIFNQSENKYSMKEIDELFNKMSVYSKMQENVVIDDREESFFSWIQPVISGLEDSKEKIDKEKNNIVLRLEKMKKEKIKAVIINVLFVIFCVIISVFITSNFKSSYEEDLSKFKQKFLHVNEIDNEFIDDLNSYVEISDVKISSLTDDAVSFVSTITMTNETYGIVIPENAKYIVMTNSGVVYEYDMFGESNKYNHYANNIGKYYRMSVTLDEFQFYGISEPKEISYIKITNVQLTKTDISTTVIKDGLEIELFSK